MKGKKEDIIGKTFGLLEGRRRVRTQHVSSHAYYECSCNCGNTCVTKGITLIGGGKVNCGCAKKLPIQPHKYKELGEAAFIDLYNHYGVDAKRRGYLFNLTKDQFKELIYRDCHYCGSKPSTTHKHVAKRNNGDIIYNGIDRADNSIGYTIENCLTCCKVCNVMKMSMSYTDFRAHVTKICLNLNL